MIAFKWKKGSILLFVTKPFQPSANKPIHESREAKVVKIKQKCEDREPKVRFLAHYSHVIVSSNFEVTTEWAKLKKTMSLSNPFDVYSLQ